jgi:uncharacterized protein
MKIDGEEIFFVEYLGDDSKVILYAPLRSYMALVKKELMNILIADETNEQKTIFLNKLKDRKVINVEKIIDEIHDSMPELSLALTDNCNLRCEYCHASAGDPHKLRTMPRELVETVINSYFERLPKNSDKVFIHFAGAGEPTYDFNLLKYCVEKCKNLSNSLNKSVSFRLATNGVFGTEIQAFLIENFDNISLSFDGPDFIQNVHRPLKNGQGSFDYVFKTAQYFYANNAKFAIRSTVSQYSLPYLKQVIDFFNNNFPGISVGLETLLLSGRAKKSTLHPPDKKEFGDKLIEILKYSENKSIRITNSASSEYDTVRPVFCSSVGIPNWTVMVDGRIYCCAKDEAPDIFNFGRFNFENNTIELDDKKIDAIKKMNVLNYEECVDCFCKYQCSGDCPDRRLTDRLNCESIRKIGVHVLNTKINS